ALGVLGQVQSDGVCNESNKRTANQRQIAASNGNISANCRSNRYGFNVRGELISRSALSGQAANGLMWRATFWFPAEVAYVLFVTR
ncbi:MAG: hypothetical protein VXA98_00050, partial [Gammaproteobacteria bacterium]